MLITYNPIGGYGHPDHIQAHRIAMYAVLLAGVPSYRRDLGAAAIDGTSWVGRKLDAMRAHATQIAEDGPFFAASRLLGESQWSKRRTCSPPECRSRTPTAGPTTCSPGWTDLAQ